MHEMGPCVFISRRLCFGGVLPDAFLIGTMIFSIFVFMSIFSSATHNIVGQYIFCRKIIME
jgi:hypothetical protein